MKKKRQVSEVRRIVVSYARVSSKDQEREGFSIPSQTNTLREYASRKGFAINREFVDVETAKQTGRASFGEMISFLKSSNASGVLLVEKTDRLCRNFRDWVAIDDLRIEIHFVKENFVLSPNSRSSDKLAHGFRLVMAKAYSDNLSEETRKGMLEKARQGIWPSYAPLGYLNVTGPDSRKTIIPDPGLGPAIYKLYALYATGKYSLKEVGGVARANGLLYRKTNGPVPTSTIQKILRNRIYSGAFDFGGQTYQGSYEPIVPRELWEQVQVILSGRGLKKTHQAKDRFAFSGLITCGHCGCALVGEIKKGRYVYYHCTGYRGKCLEPYTPEKVLEEKFTGLLGSISFSEDILTWVSGVLIRSHSDDKKFREQAIANLQKQYRRIQARIDAMYLDKLDGRIDAEFYDRNATEWRAEQARIASDIQMHHNSSGSHVEQGIRLLALARRAHELFENQPVSEKRKLLDFLLSNCKWKNGELKAQYRQPFDALAVAVAAEQGARTAASSKTSRNDNWLPGMDSNHDSRLQRPLSYH